MASVDQVTCDYCGRTADSDVDRLAWTTSVEGGRTRWFCPACSRAHLRSIEGKLDSEYW